MAPPSNPAGRPITIREWAPLALDFLAGRNLLLHTDAARAYFQQVPGVLHDYVVHSRQQQADGTVRVLWARNWYHPLDGRPAADRCPPRQWPVVQCF